MLLSFVLSTNQQNFAREAEIISGLNPLLSGRLSGSEFTFKMG